MLYRGWRFRRLADQTCEAMKLFPGKTLREAAAHGSELILALPRRISNGLQPRMQRRRPAA
jgi:hypothetical protein